MSGQVSAEMDKHEVLDPSLWESFTGTPDIITKCRWCDDNFWELSSCLSCSIALLKVFSDRSSKIDDQSKVSQ